MIVVKNIRVGTLSRESLSLSWSYEITTEDLAYYIIQVMRSEAEAGPYVQVSPNLLASAVYTFTDTGVNLHSKLREYHYRLRVSKQGESEYVEYGSAPPSTALSGGNPGSVFLEAMPDLQALESIRRFDYVLRHFTGRRVLFMHRRTTGTRCTACWDHLKRRRTKSDCSTCYDTGIAGGYYSPQETFAAKAPEKVVTSFNSLMEMDTNDIVMFMSARPRVFPRDLIIADDRRFRVIGVQRSEKLWALTRQTVHLRELSKDQVEYRIAISGWSKDNFTASPPKQYINASDITSYYNSVENLGVEK